MSAQQIAALDNHQGGSFNMKKILGVVLAAGVAAFSPQPVKAGPVDMSTITCAQLLGMNPDEISFTLIWVVGYMAGTAEELSMDPDILGKTVTDTVNYCRENEEMSVLNAATEVSG
jgi:hypothetical protein